MHCWSLLTEKLIEALLVIIDHTHGGVYNHSPELIQNYINISRGRGCGGAGRCRGRLRRRALTYLEFPIMYQGYLIQLFSIDIQILRYVFPFSLL